MKCNTWRILLVFSALLMFAFSGELAAQSLVSLTLDPDGETIGFSENLDLTATLLDDSDGSVPDSNVYFWMISANGNVAPNVDATDVNGEANSRYYSTTTELERTDTLYAIGIYNSGADTLSDTIIVRVVAKPASLTLAPTGQMIGIGEDLDLTATLLDQLDNVVVDSTVTFSVVSGGGSVSPSSPTTNGSGEAVTTYTAGSSEGTVRVAARGIYSNGAGTDTLVDTVDIEVVAKPESITLTPTGQLVGLGESLDLTATFLDQLDDPVVDSTVTFSVIIGGGSVDPASDVTDGSGEANTTFTAAGTEEIVTVQGMWVSGDLEDTVSGTVDIEVIAKPESLTFTDPGYSIVPNEVMPLYATLLDQLDDPVVDSVVSFAVIGGDGSVDPATDATNESGIASTVLTAGPSTGTISVEASWSDGTIDLADTLAVTVVDAPQQVTLNPPTASIALEADQSLTARVLSGGGGVPGVIVEFDVFPGLDGASLSSSSGITNGTGYAYTTYSAGTEAGTDTVIVTWTDEDPVSLRATLVDTTIITVNPGAATSLNVSPTDTTVVVTEDAAIVVELWDDYNNHVDATNPSQVSFSTSGDGSFGTAVVSDGLIEVAYTTDEIIAKDTITTELLSNHTLDYNYVTTVGAAPASMVLFAEPDSEVVVSELSTEEELECSLFDAYGNKSVYADYYAETSWDKYYRVYYAVSEGGGDFDSDSGYVDTFGVDGNDYNSSTTTGVYTITVSSGDAEATVDITQLPSYPDSIAFSLGVDTIGIPAASDTSLTAVLYDEYGNHKPAVADSAIITWSVVLGSGSWGTATIGDDNNWQNVFTAEELTADTAMAVVSIPSFTLRTRRYDTLVVISAEPGDLHHFRITLENTYVPDVSDGVYSEGTVNTGRVEAQDENYIRIWTYENPDDTVMLTLNGSSADASQVTWFTAGATDTMVGLSAPIMPGSFVEGVFTGYIANQVAETVTVTATDTAGHTGTSPEMSWQPIGLAAFNVGLEDGETVMYTDEPTNVEVTALDMFGNPTDVGLPINVVLSSNRPNIDLPPGGTQLMETSVDLFPIVAREECTGLIITVAALFEPSINGESYEITVEAGGIEEGPVVSNITANFGSGDILCAVAEAGPVTVKVYNKVGMEVGTLLSGSVDRGYHQLSLKGLNLASDIYFVVMQGPGGEVKKIKTALIE